MRVKENSTQTLTPILWLGGLVAACSIVALSQILSSGRLVTILAVPVGIALLLWTVLSVRRAAILFLLSWPLGKFTLIPLVSPIKLTFAVVCAAVLLQWVIKGENIRFSKTVLFWGVGWLLVALLSVLPSGPGPKTIIEVLHIIASISIALLIPSLFKSTQDLQRAAWFLFWPGVLFAALALTDLFRDYARIMGIFGNANIISLHMNIIGPLGVFGFLTEKRPGRKRLYLAGLLIVAFAFVMSGSRSGYITIPIVLGIFAFTLRDGRRMLFRAAPIFLVLFLLLAPRFGAFMDELAQRSFFSNTKGTFKIDLSSGARVLNLLSGSRMYIQNPVLGVGVGNYTRDFPDYIPRYMRNTHWANYVVQSGNLFPHNPLVLVSAETGTLGLVFFLGFVMLIPIFFYRAYLLSRAGTQRILLICFIASAVGTLISGSLHGGFAYRHFIGFFVGISYSFWREGLRTRGSEDEA
jgi:O-antigen ligase